MTRRTNKERSWFAVAGMTLLLLLVPCHSMALDGHGTIVLEISGFRNSVGQAGVLLFSSARGFPGNERLAVARLFARIDRDVCLVRFENIPYGTYAVSVFHDENGSGSLERTLFGIPKEGVGASRNPGFRFGPPDFNDARFSLDAPQRTISITMHYLR